MQLRAPRTPVTACCVALLCALAPAGAAAARPTVVVVPVGAGAGFYPGAQVARSIVKRLNASGTTRATLAYPLTTFPPPARGLERKALALLKQTRHAFQMMEFDRVSSSAEKAIKLYKQLLKSDLARDQYVELMQILASSALFAGDAKAAYRAMNDAYLVDSNPPPGKQFSPQVQELFLQVRNEPPAFGTLRLGATPRALVWFNGTLHGPASGEARLRAGLYLVRVYRPGHALYQRWFRVKPNTARDLDVLLTEDASAVEPEVVEQLRRETLASEPGTAINQLALDHGATEVILVKAGAGKGCSEDLCQVTIYWSRDAGWFKRGRTGTFRGKGAPVARLLIKMKRPRPNVAVGTQVPARVPEGIAPIGPPGSCSMDSQCSLKEVCLDGRCRLPKTPITRKWWFWTLVGAAVAGITVAIVVPATRPDAPVIEVQ